jgi:hypothetical protein
VVVDTFSSDMPRPTTSSLDLLSAHIIGVQRISLDR